MINKELRPICKECNKGEVMKMILLKSQYSPNFWLYKKIEDEWYRCDNCQAEYSEEEIKGLLLAK